MKWPFYGSRRMTTALKREGYPVNRKRVQRLMRLMGIQAIYPKPRLSMSHQDHKIYPYLLRDISIDRPGQVWCADITYLPLHYGFVYLVAILDWYSRYVLAWRLSNTLDTIFCLEALDEALKIRHPEIFNSDQGCQFTSMAFTDRLKEAGIKISMDGRGRVFDNIFIERLWRSLKYEDVYLKDYQTVMELNAGLDDYFRFYNYERPHQSLENKTPAMVYHGYEYQKTA
jgi:putative transposase